MKVAQNRVVSLIYKLTLDNISGKLIEETTENSPLTFVYGLNQMLPKFEEYLSDLSEGDSFEFLLKSIDAYGEIDEAAVVELPIESFLIDGKIDTELLRIGNVVPMQSQDGYHLDGIIKEITENTVLMDFNHPMAGKDLYFSGKIIVVREATDKELSNNHSHNDECTCCC